MKDNGGPSADAPNNGTQPTALGRG